MRRLPSTILTGSFELLMVCLIHLLIQSLRRILAPGFPATSDALAFGGGVLLESVGTYLLVRITLGFRLSADRIVPACRGGQAAAGVTLGLGAGVLFFALLILLDTFVLHLPARPEVGISFWKQGLVVPGVEEIHFRLLLTGVLLQRGWNAKAAVPLTALIFALSHEYFVAPFLFPVGLAAGWLFARYGVWSSFLMHASYNLLILLHALFLEPYQP